MHEPPIAVASRLGQVRYDIRGPLSRRAHELERDGQAILRLHIGNPGLFGFRVPQHLRDAIAEHLPRSEAYCHQQGLVEAREAIAALHRRNGVAASAEQVFIGNGVSELIDLSLRALLDEGDEVLVPAPDYPLWTAATRLNGGVPVHYPCPATREHLPDAAEIEALVTPRTRALVIINPNNPTGAVYPRELLLALVDIARRHRLVLLGDEIYDSVLYDGASHTPLAPLAADVPCISYGGLSKVHLACGYRVGWLVLSGAPARTGELLRALDLLASLRLCSNVTAQWAIRPALEGPNEIGRLTAPGGRLHAARAAICDAVGRSAFLRVVAPHGALYAFPSVDPQRLPDFDDARFALDLLEAERILLVPGSSFNIAARNHFRVTLLPEPAVLEDAFARLERQLERCAEQAARRVA
ncbi:MAG: aminotransferase class I/II-fold pyridoxal phosphate-dependent enzyme [Dokdonella sp.]|uniref:aminotransferase class I/II-fold pyridoxal phosphate-dependent enzyme n=1 Tax=Dokdonella sp. TaxID=2291710 RepID=UPI0027BAABB6|nr:aminotransferase class I/II-fold pyridoxal phosphate-dependent enzyme [Dokdonella sp.]MCW5578404.1 aminotransferase class I/II-fold pyridoxal phosphate-dependent enzyme [Dokdonella sp.]